MKLILVVVLVVVSSVVSVDAIFDPCPSEVPPVPLPVQCAVCFNPKQALFQKYPLMFKLKKALCRICCDPLKQANPCPISPPVPLAPPAIIAVPVPVPVAPAPVPAPAPVAAACPPAIDPELLRTLLALSTSEPALPTSPCGYPQPAVSSCTCV